MKKGATKLQMLCFVGGAVSAITAHQIPWTNWWMWVFIAAAVVCAIVLIISLCLPKKKRSTGETISSLRVPIANFESYKKRPKRKKKNKYEPLFYPMLVAGDTKTFL